LRFDAALRKIANHKLVLNSAAHQPRFRSASTRPACRSLPTRLSLPAVPIVELLVAGALRCSQAEAYALDWLSQNGNAIVMLEHDKDHIGCVDIMTAKNDHLYLYAIEGEA
jgi:hypothetical protein